MNCFGIVRTFGSFCGLPPVRSYSWTYTFPATTAGPEYPPSAGTCHSFFGPPGVSR